jgi:hypothetical protein
VLLDIGEVLVALADVARVDGGVVMGIWGYGGSYGTPERLDVTRVLPVAAGSGGWFTALAVDLLGGCWSARFGFEVQRRLW